ncbi:hypothetical protein FRC02_004952 [Tulasnella sp. 418]|nr:hypothetical protein FRC02_004952 [Tulasnella sp. 418]
MTPQEEAKDKGSEVLSSWGLEKFATQENSNAKPETSESTRIRSMSEHLPEHLPNPFEKMTEQPKGVKRRSTVKRPFSMGDMEGLVISDSPARAVIPAKTIEYRRSMGANIDFTPPFPNDRSSKALSSSSNHIPFPASSTPAASTPAADETDNPFSLPLPSEPSRLSRFDPKAVAHERKLSQASLNSRMILDNATEQRVRTKSTASLGTRQMLDDYDFEEPQAHPPEPRRLSRMDLLRPKVLIMPSPLQDALPRNESKLRNGFFDSTDGRPLPPGSRPLARPGIRPLSSVNGSSTSNPRLSMSLSQLTFRQSLMVGGERDVSYIDLDRNVRRASEDGQQIEKEWNDEEEEEEALRPAGKLYGKSLMDDLESRKAAIKGKQRVFTGDERPAMMQRGPLKRSSTLIDPEELKQKSSKYKTPEQVQEEVRRKRASGEPLLDFNPPKPEGGIGSTKSVFGIDKVWERELAKLRAAEEAEKEDKAKLDALDARIADKKKGSGPFSGSKSAPNLLRSSSNNSSLGPKLPVPSSGSPLKPPLNQLNSPNDSDEELGVQSRRESTYSLGARGWFADGSDDDDEGHKVSPAGSRMPSFRRKVAAASSLPQITAAEDSESDDDEDMPLAEQLARKTYRPPPRLAGLQANEESDSDDDKPIAALKKSSIGPASPAQRGKSGSFDYGTTSAMLPSFDFGGDISATGATSSGKVTQAPRKAKDLDDSSDEEVPLGLKHPDASRRLSSMPPGAGDEDEDDKPLGARFPGGQSVYGIPQMQQAQLQQQLALQQQMMLQAQMTGSLGYGMGMMGGSVMGSGFVSPFGEMGANLSMASLVGAQAVASQQQQQQNSRVDKWRRDVIS